MPQAVQQVSTLDLLSLMSSALDRDKPLGSLFQMALACSLHSPLHRMEPDVLDSRLPLMSAHRQSAYRFHPGG